MHCDIDPKVYELIQTHIKDPELPRKNRRILELMLSKHQSEVASNAQAKRHGSIIFHRKPEQVILNKSKTKIEGLLTKNMLTQETIELPCDLLIYAIGFTSSHLPGVPVNPDQKLKLLDWCRVEEQKTKVYATGWCAHVSQ